ncbi:MAG: hypothetical protein O6949_09470 [Chloroflexi bacterium]|nr:hypothetical protein [Chloroflexota bacterium]
MKKILALAMIGVPLFFDGARAAAPGVVANRQQESPSPAVEVVYERSSRGWTTSDFAAILQAMAKEIRQANRLSLEEHQVPILGPVGLKQTYLEWFRPGRPRYTFSIDVKLGEGRLFKSEKQHGALLQRHRVLGSDERATMTPGQLADRFDGLVEDLGDGALSFEGSELVIGETVDFSVVHTISGNKPVHGIQISLRFGEEVPREETRPATRYKRESESISMAEVGKLLERLGREIQERGTISLGGSTFAVSGQGSLEISSVEGGRRGGTSIGIEFGTAREGIPPRKEFHVPYERRSQRWAPADLAELVAALGETLAETGTFVLEDDSVALAGNASVEQRLTERFGPGQGGRQQRQHAFYLDIGFGQDELPVPEEEYVKELGAQEKLAKEESTDVDQAGLARRLRSLSRDLKAGRVRVGAKELAVGEDLDFRLKRTSSTDGRSHRIQVMFAFGELVGRPRAAGPPPGHSYSRESPDTRMRDIAELFRRIGTEILRDGTFRLGGADFQAGETADFEIKAREGRGLEIEVSHKPASQE